jgi:phytoene synthase
MATRFLPNEKQRSIFAIYGLCRYLDNLVDDTIDLVSFEDIDINEVDQKLAEFKQQLTDVYQGHRADDPILIAFSDTLKKYHIPIDLPYLLIEGVRTDLVKNRYKNFQEVYDYSYKVASVVGLMTSRVFGYSDDTALEYAIDLGIAMQLTNILRDVGEDLDRNRIYLPQDEMRMFEVSEADLFKGENTENFKELMRFQIRRARKYYQRSDLGIKMLSKDSQLPVYLARYNYCKILDKIEENDYNVFTKRAYLNKLEKFTILPQIFVQMQKAS